MGGEIKEGRGKEDATPAGAAGWLDGAVSSEMGEPGTNSASRGRGVECVWGRAEEQELLVLASTQTWAAVGGQGLFSIPSP